MLQSFFVNLFLNPNGAKQSDKQSLDSCERMQGSAKLKKLAGLVETESLCSEPMKKPP